MFHHSIRESFFYSMDICYQERILIKCEINLIIINDIKKTSLVKVK